jgi:hypothetical protein
MSMKFLKPVTITTAMLISSTRAETDHSAWSNATTYAATNRCISTTTHRIYESGRRYGSASACHSNTVSRRTREGNTIGVRAFQRRV